MGRPGNLCWESGRLLDPALVDAARREEMQPTRRIGVVEQMPAGACWKESGRAPISTDWEPESPMPTGGKTI